MKLHNIQARAVVAPLDPPVRTASGHVTQAPLLLIDLATDEGVVGRSYLYARRRWRRRRACRARPTSSSR